MSDPVKGFNRDGFVIILQASLDSDTFWTAKVPDIDSAIAELGRLQRMMIRNPDEYRVTEFNSPF